MSRRITRRAFIGGALATGVGATSVGVRRFLDARDATGKLARITGPIPTGSVLANSAADCPIDTVVVVMMENRSFDHYLGWLADDTHYMDAGRAAYGANFAVAGKVNQTYRDWRGRRFSTHQAGHASGATESTDKIETRGCTFRDPGHSWTNGRTQRDHGFVARGSANDQFALAYYTAADLPVYAALARRFTVFDHWHASLLGPTFPNRQYLISATSEGRKTNPNITAPGSLKTGVYQAETIVERLARANVPVGYYNTNSPLLALWGSDRVGRFIQPLDRYFEQAAAGTLPNVVFLEPFGGEPGYGTDDHPWGDVGLGQRWVREVFRAFANSAHWQRGAFIVTYDEWGGFFDHVAPPAFADDRSSPNDADNFGQAGFRVPTLLASPYALRGSVDHRAYEHTAILRFLQWRFLGAPARGPGAAGTTAPASWALTKRDRNSENMGITLRAAQPDPELGFDLAMAIPPPSLSCSTQVPGHAVKASPDPFDAPDLTDLMTKAFPPATHRPWLDDLTGPLT
jgi:phospholipase C